MLRPALASSTPLGLETYRPATRSMAVRSNTPLPAAVRLELVVEMTLMSRPALSCKLSLAEMVPPILLMSCLAITVLFALVKRVSAGSTEEESTPKLGAARARIDWDTNLFDA